MKRIRAAATGVSQALAIVAIGTLGMAAKPSVAASDPVEVTVDWATTRFATNRLSFGLNAFHGSDPAFVSNPKYRAGLAYMNPGLIRIHFGGLMESSERPQGWMDHATKRWDAAKIKKALAAFPVSGDSLLINIPEWPQWMDEDGDNRLDPRRHDDFAALCADLVRIVNVELKRGVRYWEITNEKDGPYWVEPASKGEPDHLGDLVAIYNRCALAMKRADPTIRTGGPAVARGDLVSYHRRFVQATKQNLDFFSFHVYATGSAEEPDQKVYDRAVSIGGYAGAIRKMLWEISPERPIPAHLNEYNISWTWTTRDPRMTNNKGAVFDALATLSAAAAGVEATNAWNECDGVYGKMALDFTLRPGAHLLHLMNQYLIGEVVAASSSDQSRVVVWAVKNNRDGRNALLVINRSDAAQPLTITGKGGNPVLADSTCHEISARGYTILRTPTKALAGGMLVVPEHSVRLFILRHRR